MFPKGSKVIELKCIYNSSSYQSSPKPERRAGMRVFTSQIFQLYSESKTESVSRQEIVCKFKLKLNEQLWPLTLK